MRILIAEDDITSRTILTEVLKKNGHEVVATVNGAEAWQCMQQPDSPRLVILDWMMPEMNGVELCRRVRALEAGQQPYIIMLTTKSEKADIIAGLDAGANDYLVKPFDAVEIRARVDVGRRMIEIQAALTEGEKKYHELFESSPAGLYQSTMDGKIISANQTCLEISHCPPSKRDAWFARNIRQSYVYPEDGRRFMKVMERDGSVKGFEAAFHRWDGSIGWLSNSARIVRDENGQPVSISGSFEDITERKRAEAERERLVVAIEQLAEVVVITDNRGTIQYVNPAFEAVTGYTRGEVIGQNLRILKSGEQDEAFYRGLWETLRSGNVWQGRFANRKKNGAIYTEEATISPVRDATGGIANFVAVKRDITDDLSLQAQLNQAQKMESVGRLAGGVAHDFNNILQVILGNAQLAIMQAGPGDPVCRNLEDIQSAAQRAADLTRQLLAFASRQVVTLRTLDFNETVGSILKILHSLIGENIKLGWTPCAGLWPVRMDPSQADQILANLCINARDAIDGVGTLHVATENVQVDEFQAVRYEDFLPGDYVLLSVSDTGCGMDKETQGRIFEPFFTTKAVGKGIGLGLATVYGIVRQNHGHIGVYS